MNTFTEQRTIPPGVMVVVAPLIFLTWGYFAFFAGTPSPESVNETHELGAIEVYVQAQQFVKQTLKAPSTARFPLDPIHVGTDGNGLYQAEGYVDAENSFGAPIRSHWMLNMRPVGDKWMLETMQIDGKIVYDITKNQ